MSTAVKPSLAINNGVIVGPVPRPDREAVPSATRRGARIPREGVSAAMRGSHAMAIGTICLLAATSHGLSLFSVTLGSFLPFLLLGGLSIFALHVCEAWTPKLNASRLKHLGKIANVAGVSLLGGVVALNWLTDGGNARHFILTGLQLWLAMVLLQGGALMILGHLSRLGRLRENVVVVGATANARKLVERNRDSDELNIIGIFDDRLERVPSEVAGVPVLGTLDDLLNWDQLPDMDRIVVTVTSEARERVRGLIDRLRVLPQRVVLLLDLEGFDPETESLANIANTPGAYVSGAPQDIPRALLKRGSDIFFSLLLMALFAPVFLAAAAAIKLEDGGPIFFRQKRHGFNNQVIRVWKFRSMTPDKDAEERMTAQTGTDDKRVTRVGRIIRATSIDELPQLINVLQGDMSLVGPRPHAIGMTAEATEVHTIVSDYAHRHRVKPGLTGWAQVNGSRGPVHVKDEVRERVRLDLEYINRASFWFDIYVMAATAPCLLGDRIRPR